MMLPWQKSNPVEYINFVCEHCGKQMHQTAGQLILCTCLGAQKAEHVGKRPLERLPIEELRQQRKVKR